MTEQTGRRSVKAFDPYAERDESSHATAAKPDDGHRAGGDEKPSAEAAEAITRATAALGEDDGAHR